MKQIIYLSEKELENLDNIKEFRKNASKYYQNHIQGKTIYFLENEVKIGKNIQKYEFLIAQDSFGKRFYYIKNVPDSFVRQKVPGAIEDITIITD